MLLLGDAAESTFGAKTWPADIPAPQAWMEIDVESPEAVSAAVKELEAAGHRILRGSHEEPWGQTTSRLLTPEGFLLGVTYPVDAQEEGQVAEAPRGAHSGHADRRPHRRR